MALHADFVTLLRDKILPLADDTTNWDDTVLERYWLRGVEMVRGLLDGNIANATITILATGATATDLSKLLFGGATAYLIWNKLTGIDDEEAVTRGKAELDKVMELIHEIKHGERKVYDSAGAEISVTTDGAGDYAGTQASVEPAFRRARRDNQGNLLGSEIDGSLDSW